MSLVEVIRCRGAFGIVKSEKEFAFRIYPDGSTMVTIASVGAATGRFEPQQQQLDDDPLWYAVVDSIAHRTSEHDADSTRGRTYEIEFSVASWDPELAHGEEMSCTGQISSHDGIHGSYTDGEDIPSVLTPFRLRSQSDWCYMEPLSAQFFPLTPGVYRLDGWKVAEIGILSGVTLHMELMEDGLVRGEVKEMIYGSKFPLMGSWVRDHLDFTRHHNSEDLGDCYVYQGTCALSGLRGTWNHRFEELADDPEEFGIFDFQVMEGKRVWSPAVHQDYPRPFQECSLLLLLSTLRAPANSWHVLPSAVWRRVLSFCDYYWFGGDVFCMSELQE